MPQVVMNQGHLHETRFEDSFCEISFFFFTNSKQSYQNRMYPLISGAHAEENMSMLLRNTRVTSKKIIKVCQGTVEEG
jgi:hypothetical protein